MKLLYHIKPPCPECPYKLRLIQTFDNPCPACKQNGYKMFQVFINQLTSPSYVEPKGATPCVKKFFENIDKPPVVEKRGSGIVSYGSYLVTSICDNSPENIEKWERENENLRKLIDRMRKQAMRKKKRDYR